MDHQKFIEWLQYHHHEDLKNLIVNTAALRTEIDNLLREDQAKMMQKLDQIGDILTSLLGRMDEFKGLAAAVAPNAQLSDQAIFILRQFVESGAQQFSYMHLGSEAWSMQISQGEQSQIGVIEPRFIVDDLNQLVALQLITETPHGENRWLYGITRSAVRLIESIDQKPNAQK